MAKRKSWLCLCLVLALILVGCGNIEPQQSTPDNTTISVPEITEPTPTEPEPVITCQYLPQEIENPENLPVLKWVCLTERPYGGGVRTWNETAATELNQMLADKNMPFRVQFVLLTMDQWLLNSNWFSRPEAKMELEDADLVYGMMTATDMQEYLLPITEYVKGTAEPSLKNSVPHQYNWLIGTVSDEIYGIPTALNQAYAGGWIVNAELLNECGLTEDSFSMGFAEMDDGFAQIYTKNGNKPFLYLTNASIRIDGNAEIGQIVSTCPSVLSDIISQQYKGIGASFAIDYSSETPVVVNTLETNYTREVQQAIAGYIAAGYVTNDLKQAQLQYRTVFGNSNYTDESGNLVIPNTTAVFHHTSAGGMLSGLSANTQHKEEALSLLNLIAENEEFRIQLFYGMKGRDYTVTKGYYEIAKYGDGSSYSLDFLSPLSYFSGLTANKETANFLSPGTENWSLFTYDGKNTLETYQGVLDNSILSYPIIFDYSGFESELKAMEAVYEKYFPDFSNLTEEQYDQMLQELEIAGSKKVLDALQKQLEQWISKNPN